MAKGYDQEFAAWVNERQVTLLRAARIICFDIQNAEDVLQETLIDVFENLEAYAIRIMVSKHADLRRKWARKKDELETTLEALDAAIDGSDSTDEITERLLVHAALKSLTPAQRAVLVLTYEEGYALKEIARSLQMPMGTAASHLARGRLAVASFIQGTKEISAPVNKNRPELTVDDIEDAELVEEKGGEK
ncbi:MAG: RNA polymerase sigma factor [Actinobacteria bacterium]|nr:RNA polymerase sigma factor [Actinomycetota bacterium]